MTEMILDTNGEYVGSTSSVSICPFCEEDWFDARQREFGSKEEAAPFFETIIDPTEYPATRLTQLTWGVKCYSCGKSHIRIMLLSPLFNVECWDGDTYVGYD